MLIQAFVATYAAVLVAEVMGDKLLYTTGVLATRYRAPPMLCGIALAFMAKMGAAVLVGHALGTLPRTFLAVVTAVGFVWMASKLLGDTERDVATRTAPTSAQAALVSFASVFFSEWADLGQLTAAAMAAQLRAPIVVWMGAVMAMMTKTAVAVTIGVSMRHWLHRHVPRPVIRYGSVSVLLLIGALAVAETLLR